MELILQINCKILIILTSMFEIQNSSRTFLWTYKNILINAYKLYIIAYIHVWIICTEDDIKKNVIPLQFKLCSYYINNKSGSEILQLVEINKN